MRIHSRLLATAADAGSGTSLRRTPLALLPPIPLYRRILRTHRKRLPSEERFIGDMYVKQEFHAHKTVDNPVQIIGFLTEWQLYAQMLEGDNWRDAKLDKAKLDKMSDQQVGQLYELMQAIRKEDLEENDPENNPKH